MRASARPIPELTTERLYLTIPGPERAPAMAAFHQRNREHFAPWDPQHPDEFFTERFWRERFAEIRRAFKSDQSASFVLHPRDDPEGVIIGSANLSNIVRGVFHACYLGYSLDAAHEGQSYMREALEAILDYAFRELHLHRVMANYMPHNERSGGLLRRLGFIPEGYARNYLRIAGEWRDHVLTARMNPDW